MTEYNDFTPLSLGIESMRGMMVTLIPRNTAIPTKSVQRFTTSTDNQTVFSVVVLQGEQPMAFANTILASFEVEDISMPKQGIPIIEVSFDIDINGILRSTAHDKQTGNQQTITITNNSGGLSFEEIDRHLLPARDADLFSLERIASTLISPLSLSTSPSNTDIAYLPEDQEAKEIGRHFNVVKIVSGGMGRVYIVTVPGYPLLALKTLRNEIGFDEGHVNRFFREASLWIKLGKHPNIVTAYSIQRVAGKPFLFLEGVDGSSLADVIAVRPPSIDLALEYAVQICEGMDFAYSKAGLIHRDLKPDNVLVTRDGTAKITDFGLANALEGVSHESIFDANLMSGIFQTQLGTVAGTCAYMPPEQFLSLGFTDTRSDIYSFGVMLYTMLTGLLPFAGTSWGQYKRMHLDETPSTLILNRHGISEEVSSIVMKCLSKYPEQRYQTFKDLKTELVTALFNMGRIYRAPKLTGAYSAYDLSLDGFLMLCAEEVSEASRFFTAALSLAPMNKWAWVGEALCKGKRGDINLAIECVENVLHSHPRFELAQRVKELLLKGHVK